MGGCPGKCATLVALTGGAWVFNGEATAGAGATKGEAATKTKKKKRRRGKSAGTKARRAAEREARFGSKSKTEGGPADV